MGTLESKVEVSEPIAELLPKRADLVQGVAREVEAAMREEAGKFGRSLVGAPELVDVETRKASVLLPPEHRMVSLVFRCDTT
jgi:hypothetical protein